MHRFKKSVVNVAAYIAFLGTVALFGSSTARGQDPRGQPSPVPNPVSVKVTNTQSEPVPVTGTINVGNLGSAPLTVTGTVNVGNSDAPLLVRDVDSSARWSFQWTGTGSCDRDNRCDSGFTVPAGKRLVIEFVSMKVSQQSDALFSVPPPTYTADLAVDTGVFPPIYIATSPPSKHYYQPGAVTGDHATWHATSGISQSVRLYANPGKFVLLRGTLYQDPERFSSFEFTVSGYLVDVP
jgi:hypothetical protein